MLLQLLTIIAICGNLEGKPVIIRNVSDCSITEDKILHYQGKHSFTKFEHECLPWTDLQIIHPDIINEANFFNDPSVKQAKNYCRNPSMNINGPWCFVQDENEDSVSMEACDVCQSLASRPTLPTNIGSIEEVPVVAVDNNFFNNVRDEIQRYGVYLRQKLMEMFDRMREKMRQFGTSISDRFNFSG
ncbi:unnamed protein product [Adineta steineri]|uniref:Kringle domain-containing protein n=1 Tax=Adineta steineri TaxID=433720 RepID=A0A814B6E6_9BILA|nr:unnamed protein product [Adineta steineri]CAF0942857.1 unnamed protein product [Adineta steineri]CAF3571633.1 unnamed protein product [Adineta steineri]CAF3692953.1 unnamed protein product [Adineta steineri]